MGRLSGPLVLQVEIKQPRHLPLEKTLKALRKIEH